MVRASTYRRFTLYVIAAFILYALITVFNNSISRTPHVDKSSQEDSGPLLLLPPNPVKQHGVDAHALFNKQPHGVVNFNIQKRRTVPFCSKESNLLESPVSGEEEKFQLAVAPKEVFVYSAYYTKGSAGVNTPKIVIIGLWRRNFSGHLFCQIWFRDSDTVMSTVPATYAQYPEDAGRLYVAGSLQCTVNSAVTGGGEVPYAVSVVSAECEHALNMLPITSIPPRQAEDKVKFSVCVAPLNLHYNHVDQFVEWLEINRLLGADHIYLYNHTVGDVVSRVMRQYREEGFITLLQWPVPVLVHVWPLPPNYQEEVKYFAQMAQLNDCLLRSQAARFRYTVFADLDEILLPRHHSHWRELVASIDHGQFSSITFRNTFFKTEWPSNTMAQNETIRRLNITTLMKTLREVTIFQAGLRSKLIVDPHAVAVMGVHNVWQYSKDNLHATLLSPDQGLVHHYRNWEGMGEQTRVEDFSIHRFANDIIESIRRRKLALHLIDEF